MIQLQQVLVLRDQSTALTEHSGVEVLLDNREYHPNMVVIKINDFNRQKPVVVLPVRENIFRGRRRIIDT